MSGLVSIRRKLNETIGLVQDEMARGGKNAFALQLLHDDLVRLRDGDLGMIPLDPMQREEALDTHPTVIAHAGKQEAA